MTRPKTKPEANATPKKQTTKEKKPAKADVKLTTKKRTPKPSDLPKEILKCSFCGHSVDASKVLIAGPSPYSFICDNCVEICVTILTQEYPVDWHSRLTRILAQIDIENKISLASKKNEKASSK